MAWIKLHDIKFFAFHGCFKEESIIGTQFSVDLSMDVDTLKAQQSDNLNDTLDYQSVYQKVKEEMAIKSHLLEHVANRIIKRLHQDFEILKYMEITIHKINPPLGNSELGSVSVTLTSDMV